MKIPKQVVVLGLVSLFTDAASEMLYPVMPLFLTSVLGASMITVGLIEGLAEITAGFLKGYAGILSDKLQKRKIFIVLGYGVSAIVKPLPGFFPSIFTVVFSRLTDRIGKGIRSAPRDALLSSYCTSESSGRIFGFHRGMDTIGAALGPAIALILLSIYPDNYTLIFIAAVIPSFAAVLFTLYVKDIKREKNNPLKLSYISFIKSSPVQYKILLSIMVLFSFANSSDVFLILRSQDISGSSTLAILSYIIYNVVYAAASYPLGHLSDRYSKRIVLSVGLLLFSVIYFGFAYSSEFIFIIILFILYGIYAASTEGITKAWISDLIQKEQKGTAFGLLNMLSSFAILLGSILAGFLWDKFGPDVTFAFSSFISLICVFALLLIKKLR